MKPLEGIKVVDLTTYLAAPTTVRVLGEWGADCVKIESQKAIRREPRGQCLTCLITMKKIWLLM